MNETNHPPRKKKTTLVRNNAPRKKKTAVKKEKTPVCQSEKIAESEKAKTEENDVLSAEEPGLYSLPEETEDFSPGKEMTLTEPKKGKASFKDKMKIRSSDIPALILVSGGLLIGVVFYFMDKQNGVTYALLSVSSGFLLALSYYFLHKDDESQARKEEKEMLALLKEVIPGLYAGKDVKEIIKEKGLDSNKFGNILLLSYEGKGSLQVSASQDVNDALFLLRYLKQDDRRTCLSRLRKIRDKFDKGGGRNDDVPLLFLFLFQFAFLLYFLFLTMGNLSL